MRARRRMQVIRSLLSVGGITLLAFLTFLVANGAYSMHGRMREALELRRAAQDDRTRLEVREEELTASVDELSSDRGVEEQVRQRFGLARPGEGEVVLVETKATTTVTRKPKGFFSWFDGLF